MRACAEAHVSGHVADSFVLFFVHCSIEHITSPLYCGPTRRNILDLKSKGCLLHRSTVASRVS
jgi:hypothetical protein